MKKRGYQERFYREWIKKEDLIIKHILIKETDLFVSTDRLVDEDFLKTQINRYRADIEGYIAKDKDFLQSLVPVKVTRDAPSIVKDMAKAAKLCCVGPMAAVSGAIAQYLGRSLLDKCHEVIIENGGDIFLKVKKQRKIGIYAGDSPLSGKIALKIEPRQTPLGVCTSSGTVGHSLSFGNADGAVIVAKSVVLADALATASGNLVKDARDINKAIEFTKTIPGVKGAVIIVGRNLGIWGDIEIINVN